MNTRKSLIYCTLRKYPKVVTSELVERICAPSPIPYDGCLKLSPLQKAIYAWEHCAKGYDVIFVLQNIGKEFGPFCDAIFDIRVYNATYATLMHEEKTPLIKCDDYWTLPNLTLENPMFLLHYGVNIDTDGDKITCNAIFIHTPFGARVYDQLLQEKIKYLKENKTFMYE